MSDKRLTLKSMLILPREPYTDQPAKVTTGKRKDTEEERGKCTGHCVECKKLEKTWKPWQMGK